jgi:hypothetical protein
MQLKNSVMMSNNNVNINPIVIVIYLYNKSYKLQKDNAFEEKSVIFCIMRRKMVNDKIINYYRLCSLREGGKRHLIDELQEQELDVVLTKKEINLFFRKKDGKYIAKEIVVGAADEDYSAGRGLIVVI